MPSAVEIQSISSQIGWLPTIFMVLGIVFAGLLVKYIYSLAQDIHSMAEKVGKLDASVSHEKGSPIIHYDLMRAIENELQELRQDAEVHATNAAKHHEDVIRLNSQEAYAHCNIDKCPHLITVIGQIKAVGSLFEQFNIRAEESRNATGASLQDIQQQMTTLAAEVSAQSKQVVQLLGDVLVGRKK